MRIFTKIAAGAVTVGAMAAIGLAGAAIISDSGTAKVTGNVGSLQPVTNVDSGNTFDTALWPGHSVGCTVVVHNPNSVDVLINSLTPAGILVASPSGALVFQGDPSVAAGWAEFATINPTNFVVGAGQNGSYHVTNCASVDNNDDTAYAGDSVAVHYTVAFQSN